MLAVHYHYTTGLFSGILGAVVTITLLIWLAARTQKDARMVEGKKVLEYGLSVRTLGWILLLVSLFIAYAAYRAAANQIVMAWFCGVVFLLMSLSLILEFHFVKILFDDEFIYTFSPWRLSRKIPWADISGYTFSEINKWHILKTTSHGRIRLSFLLSGLGSLSQELEKRKLPHF